MPGTSVNPQDEIFKWIVHKILPTTAYTSLETLGVLVTSNPTRKRRRMPSSRDLIASVDRTMYGMVLSKSLFGSQRNHNYLITVTAIKGFTQNHSYIVSVNGRDKISGGRHSGRGFGDLRSK